MCVIQNEKIMLTEDREEEDETGEDFIEETLKEIQGRNAHAEIDASFEDNFMIEHSRLIDKFERTKWLRICSLSNRVTK